MSFPAGPRPDPFPELLQMEARLDPEGAKGTQRTLLPLVRTLMAYEADPTSGLSLSVMGLCGSGAGALRLDTLTQLAQLLLLLPARQGWEGTAGLARQLCATLADRLRYPTHRPGLTCTRLCQAARVLHGARMLDAPLLDTLCNWIAAQLEGGGSRARIQPALLLDLLDLLHERGHAPPPHLTRLLAQAATSTLAWWSSGDVELLLQRWALLGVDPRPLQQQVVDAALETGIVLPLLHVAQLMRLTATAAAPPRGGGGEGAVSSNGSSTRDPSSLRLLQFLSSRANELYSLPVRAGRSVSHSASGPHHHVCVRACVRVCCVCLYVLCMCAYVCVVSVCACVCVCARMFCMRCACVWTTLP